MYTNSSLFFEIPSDEHLFLKEKTLKMNFFNFENNLQKIPYDRRMIIKNMIKLKLEDRII